MRERPADIRDSDVAAALAREWALTAKDLSYLPVGFGGYHWLAADQTGSRWFVTVSDLAAPWMLDLPAAMQTAAWLATEAGLEFVVAPAPTRAGQIVGSLDSRHALTLFPYVDTAPSRFEDPVDDADRAAIIDMLAALHTATPEGIQLPCRPPCACSCFFARPRGSPTGCCPAARLAVGGCRSGSRPASRTGRGS